MVPPKHTKQQRHQQQQQQQQQPSSAKQPEKPKNDIKPPPEPQNSHPNVSSDKADEDLIRAQSFSEFDSHSLMNNPDLEARDAALSRRQTEYTSSSSLRPSASVETFPHQQLSTKLPHVSSSKLLSLRDSGIVKKRVVLEVLNKIDLLRESNALALDIGGTLTKLMYLQPYSKSGDVVGSMRRVRKLLVDELDPARPLYLAVDIPILGGMVHFFTFETRFIEECVKFVSKHWQTFHHRDSSASSSQPEADHRKKKQIRATGGGAYKYAELFAREIDVELICVDEMASTVTGLNFLLSQTDQEVYHYRPPPDVRPEDPLPPLDQCREFLPRSDSPFPYLLVNIGSGVSILQVLGNGKYERVSGSSLGGGTFWGLSRMLTNCKTFDEVIELTNFGENGNVDMLVGDIYGTDYSKLGLPANVIAASFGKVTMSRETSAASLRNMLKEMRRAIVGTCSLWVKVLLATPGIGHVLRMFNLDKKLNETLANRHLMHQFSAPDVSLSLLRMVSYNIGQIAYLNAKQYDLQRIYFAGNFIRDHPFTVSTLSYAVNFWSRGQMQARFLVHDGYLGAVGAFLGGGSAMPMLKDSARIPSTHEAISSSSLDQGSHQPETKAPSENDTVDRGKKKALTSNNSAISNMATNGKNHGTEEALGLGSLVNGHHSPSQHSVKHIAINGVENDSIGGDDALDDETMARTIAKLSATQKTNQKQSAPSRHQEQLQNATKEAKAISESVTVSSLPMDSRITSEEVEKDSEGWVTVSSKRLRRKNNVVQG